MQVMAGEWIVLSKDYNAEFSEIKKRHSNWIGTHESVDPDTQHRLITIVTMEERFDYRIISEH